MERQEPWISAHKGTGRKGGREPPMGEGPQDDAPPPILEGDPGSAPAEHWSKNGCFCTMARQERYKKDRILLAKSAGFGPAAALSGFQSGGRLCRSARSRYRLCPTTPPALTGCGKRGRRVIFIHESAP